MTINLQAIGAGTALCPTTEEVVATATDLDGGNLKACRHQSRLATLQPTVRATGVHIGRHRALRSLNFPRLGERDLASRLLVMKAS